MFLFSLQYSMFFTFIPTSIIFSTCWIGHTWSFSLVTWSKSYLSLQTNVKKKKKIQITQLPIQDIQTLNSEVTLPKPKVWNIHSTRCWTGLNANKHAKGEKRKKKKKAYNTLLRTVHNKTLWWFQDFLSCFPGSFLPPCGCKCPAECNTLAKFLFSSSLVHIYPQTNKDTYLSTNLYVPCWKCLCPLHRAEQQLPTATGSVEDKTERWRQCCFFFYVPSLLSSWGEPPNFSPNISSQFVAKNPIKDWAVLDWKLDEHLDTLYMGT